MKDDDKNEEENKNDIKENDEDGKDDDQRVDEGQEHTHIKNTIGKAGRKKGTKEGMDEKEEDNVWSRMMKMARMRSQEEAGNGGKEEDKRVGKGKRKFNGTEN